MAKSANRSTLGSGVIPEQWRSRLFEFQGDTARTVVNALEGSYGRQIYSRGYEALADGWCRNVLLVLIACLGAVRCGGWQWSEQVVRARRNLCKLVSTAKLEVATGLKLPTPAWEGVFCRWEVSPGRLKDSVWLSVHRGLGKKGVEP